MEENFNFPGVYAEETETLSLEGLKSADAELSPKAFQCEYGESFGCTCNYRFRVSRLWKYFLRHLLPM